MIRLLLLLLASSFCFSSFTYALTPAGVSAATTRPAVPARVAVPGRTVVPAVRHPAAPVRRARITPGNRATRAARTPLQ
jgi:hypothetical protein